MCQDVGIPPFEISQGISGKEKFRLFLYHVLNLFVSLHRTIKTMIMGKKPLGTLWMRTDRAKENGECQILLRYFCRKYVFVSTGIYCKPEEWDAKKGVIKGSGRTIKEKNYLLTKTKEECDRKIMNYDGDINPVVIDKLLKNQSSEKFFEYANHVWDEALEQKRISVSSHKHRKVQLKIIGDWANNNGYKGVTIKEMGEGSFFRDFYSDRIRVLKESTISTYLITLLAICKMMKEREKMSGEDIERLKQAMKSFRKAREYNDSKEEEKKQKWMERDEVRRLEGYTTDNEEYRKAVDVYLFSLYTCGLRISDVLTLEWSHITDDYHINKAQVKTRNKHKIAPMVNDKGRAILNRYRGKGKYVFGFFQDDDEIGGEDFYRRLNMMEAAINRRLKTVGKSIGINRINPHLARHTATVMLLSSGMDTTTVAYLLGHSNTAQIEKTYGDYMKEFKRSKAEQAADILNNI